MVEAPKVAHALLAAVILSAVTVALQWKSGAYQSDIGIHADEPSHYVTGLMMRDYFLHGLGRNPMAFVQDYYDHYPKVALGHYPPGFYVAEGLWTLVFSTGRVSVLVLSAAFCVLLAWLTWRMLTPHLHPLFAAAAGLLCCALPLVQRYTSIIMSDMMLSVMCLLAALAFARYLETGKTKFSFLFGLLAAAAILTKASALFLALLPLPALLLAGRIAWCKRPSLWVATLPVVVLCLPWMLFTFGISKEGMKSESTLEFARGAVPYYLTRLPGVFGFTLLIPACAGIVSLFAHFRKYKTALEPFWAVMLPFPFVLLVLYCTIPAGLDPRYLLPAVPPVLALALLGLRSLHLATPARFDRFRHVFPLLLVSLFLWEIFTIPKKSQSGFGDAAAAILESRISPTENILISSNSAGEGSLIAELALREPHPALTVLRASKELSASDWLGRDYELRFNSPEELRAHLAAADIQWIVTDTSIPEHYRVAHHDLLEKTMAADPGPFIVAAKLPAVRATALREFTGTLTIYRKHAGAAP